MKGARFKMTKVNEIQLLAEYQLLAFWLLELQTFGILKYARECFKRKPILVRLIFPHVSTKDSLNDSYSDNAFWVMWRLKSWKKWCNPDDLR